MPTHSIDPLQPNDRLREFIQYLRILNAKSPEESIPSWAANEIANAFQLPVMALDLDPMVRLGDLGGAYLDLLGQLAEHPDPEVRAALPRMAYGLVKMAMTELREMYGRDAEGHQMSPDP
jgi:hypothetical protein